MNALGPERWHRLASCGSTNDEAQKLARAGAAAGTVVVAAEQTRGRGRLGRSWHSPAGQNLYLSVVLRPRLPPSQAPLLGLCAGLAMFRAARSSLSAPAPLAADSAQLRLKWPNDLLGRSAAAAAADGPYLKLGGILTELVCAGMDIDFVVIGVGCNVNGRDFPVDVAATSLCLLAPQAPGAFSIDALGTQFLVELAALYDIYLGQGPRPIRDAFVQAAGLGQHHPPVVVRPAVGEPLVGTPLDLGEGGELLLRLQSGSVVTILAGDVALAAPAKIASQEPVRNL